MTTLLERIEIESAPNPTAAIIWMHGLGASGDDFAAIVPELDLTGSPAIRFVFPHAPVMPVTINGGYVMPAWYDIFGTELGAGAVRHEDAAGIVKSQQHIEALIANEVSRGIHPSKIVLAGFSQGCAVALQTGLRHKAKLAGIMAWSDFFCVPFRHVIATLPTPSGDCLIENDVGDLRNALMAMVQSGLRWAVA